MPASAIDTYTVDSIMPLYRPDDALTLSVKLKASIVYQKGSVLAWNTSTLLFEPYANGGLNGIAIPRGILKYALTTDANGGYQLGPLSGIRYDAPAYFKGVFSCADLPAAGVGGLVSTAIADANVAGGSLWRLIQGIITAGVLDIG